jgi:hypothetical protein
MVELLADPTKQRHDSEDTFRKILLPGTYRITYGIHLVGTALVSVPRQMMHDQLVK